MKTLILCRHAKADYPNGVNEIDRPLKDKGIKDANKQGELLKNQDFMPDLIISSPAERAFTTAEIIAEQIGYEKEIRIESAIYHKGEQELIELIQSLPQELNTVMIFGHNPTMSETVRQLTRMNSYFDMPTCAMVCLENSMNDWGVFGLMGTRLRWMLVPRLSRKDGE